MANGLWPAPRTLRSSSIVPSGGQAYGLPAMLQLVHACTSSTSIQRRGVARRETMPKGHRQASTRIPIDSCHAGYTLVLLDVYEMPSPTLDTRLALSSSPFARRLARHLHACHSTVLAMDLLLSTCDSPIHLCFAVAGSGSLLFMTHAPPLSVTPRPRPALYSVCSMTVRLRMPRHMTWSFCSFVRIFVSVDFAQSA